MIAASGGTPSCPSIRRFETRNPTWRRGGILRSRAESQRVCHLV
ncbi:hypothetical protein ACHAXS_006524 [Conticribra weissflogii]